jgi:hypothetical protein
LFCPDDAIEYRDGVCSVDAKLCTLCGSCHGHCPSGALQPSTDLTELQIFQQAFGNPGAGTKVTGGNAGRGGQEVKTLDVSPRLKEDEISLCLDIGRPGVGVRMRDAERIVLALLAAGMEFLPGDAFPLATIIPDRKTGKFRPDCLDMRLHTLLMEGVFHKSKLPAVLKALQEVSREIDTVICPGLILAVDANCDNPALACLDDLGIPRPHRGKINVGLGRPFPPDLAKLPPLENLDA